MKTIHQLPTREPPRPEPPWPAGQWPPRIRTKTFAQTETTNQTPQNISENNMKKDRKKQDDRLLKRLSLSERRMQERLRAQIAADQLFMAV